MFSAELSRETTRVAISELPPSSKKLSSTPTRSTPSTSMNASAIRRSRLVPGARNSTPVPVNSGVGNAFRSSLPTAVRGSSSTIMMLAGTMCEGTRPARCAVISAPVSVDPSSTVR